MTLEDISHCTSVLFSAPILDVISWWIIQDHPTRKDKHSGSFFIVNYPNFPSDFFLFRKLFPLTQSHAFFFFQDTAEWKCGRSPSFYSPLVHKNTELCYLWLRSDLRAESVKLRGIVRARQPTIIFAISPEFCVLYFYPFKAHVTDRWQQPGWEMGWGFVHGIMQHHISANSRVLWLSKTSPCISLEVLWKIQPSPSLSLSPVLFTIIYLAETVLH